MNEEDELNRFYEELDEFIQEVMESTAETRQLWTVDDWSEALFWNPALVEEKDFPAAELSPQQWADIITNGDGFEAQYCPCPEKVLPLLREDDFRDKDTEYLRILYMSCAWIAPLLPDIPLCDPGEEEEE